MIKKPSICIVALRNKVKRLPNDRCHALKLATHSCLLNFVLASAYHDGRGVSQGLARAAYYYEAAARQRLAVAQLYIRPRNEIQAASAKRLSINLAQMLIDLSRAQHWYAEAAAQGDDEAIRKHRELGGLLLFRCRRARSGGGLFDFRLLTLFVDNALIGLLVHVSTKFGCHLIE